MPKPRNELPTPYRVMPALGLPHDTCSRCFMGIDDDGDGDCKRCARLTTAGAVQLRLDTVTEALLTGKLARAEAMVRFNKSFPLTNAMIEERGRD